MRKDRLSLICAYVDIFSTVAVFGWLAIISPYDSLIQGIVCIVLIILSFIKMCIWGVMLEINRVEEREMKKYKTPEISVDIGGDTYKIKVESEGEK